MGEDITQNISTSVSKTFLDNFHLLHTDSTANNSLKFYCPLVDANAFNYDGLIPALSEAAGHYCLSRRTWQEYKDEPMRLSKLVRSKFRNLATNEGELGELMLFSFLETDLNAPKIATKMELKTNPNMYFNGADGVHYLKTSENTYQLIFGESKVYTDMMEGITAAISSIHKFKTETIKDDETGELRGITFERGLINAHLAQEAFSEEDREFIKSLIYPKASNPYFVDTAFAIFVLFNVTIPADKKKLPNAEFRTWLFERLKAVIVENIDKIYAKITKKQLDGHPFYFYLVPFEELDSAKDEILKEALS